MKLLLWAILTTSLIEVLRLPLGPEVSSRPKSLHKKTGKLGCFQFKAVHSRGLKLLNTIDRTTSGACARCVLACSNTMLRIESTNTLTSKAGPSEKAFSSSGVGYNTWRLT